MTTVAFAGWLSMAAVLTVSDQLCFNPWPLCGLISI